MDKPIAPQRWQMRLAGLGGRTLAIIVVLALVVAAAHRGAWRVDLSPDRRFTLDPALETILVAQDEPVSVVAIWPAEADEQVEPLVESLHAMVRRNPRLSYRRIDPARDQPALEQFAKRYQDRSGPAIYLCRGERAFKITVTDVGLSRRTLQQDVGGALLTLADPNPPQARFLLGHGELQPDGSDDGGDALVRALTLGGFRTVLGGEQPIDPGSLLVIAGPIGPLGAPTIARIDQHLVDGGSLLVFADQRMPADLAILLRRHGIFVGPGIPRDLGDPAILLADNPEPMPPTDVVSLTRNARAVTRQAEFPYYNLLIGPDLLGEDGTLHPALVATAAARRDLLSPGSTPVLVLALDPVAQRDLVQRLAAVGRLPRFAEPPARLFATAPGDAWLTPHDQQPQVPKDLEQATPIPLAAAARYLPDERSTRQGEGARIAVWGSRSAVSNATLRQEQYANVALVVDLARWLNDRGQANPIPPAETVAYRVVGSDRTLWIITALLLAVMPALAVGGALLTWFDRR